MIDSPACRICGADALREIPDYRALPRVTSDCVPFRDEGRLMICSQCGAAQSPADQQWFEEIREIYSSYRMFHQSGGVDQHMSSIHSPGNSGGETMCFWTIWHPFLGFHAPVRVVDVGCGTGVTLKAPRNVADGVCMD